LLFSRFQIDQITKEEVAAALAVPAPLPNQLRDQKSANSVTVTSTESGNCKWLFMVGDLRSHSTGPGEGVAGGEVAADGEG